MVDLGHEGLSARLREDKGPTSWSAWGLEHSDWWRAFPCIGDSRCSRSRWSRSCSADPGWSDPEPAGPRPDNAAIRLFRIGLRIGIPPGKERAWSGRTLNTGRCLALTVEGARHVGHLRGYDGLHCRFSTPSRVDWQVLRFLWFPVHEREEQKQKEWILIMLHFVETFNEQQRVLGSWLCWHPKHLPVKFSWTGQGLRIPGGPEITEQSIQTIFQDFALINNYLCAPYWIEHLFPH